MQLMSVSAATRHLGYKTRSQLCTLINDCHLHEHVHEQEYTGQRLVDIDGLREKLQCICQWRPNSVFLRRPAVVMVKESQTPKSNAKCISINTY